MARKLTKKEERCSTCEEAERAERKCKVKDCNNKTHSKGYCGMHYSRWHRYGRLHRVKTKQGNQCIVDRCENKPYVRNYCMKHYAHWKLYGNPHHAEKTMKMHELEKKFGKNIEELCFELYNEQGLLLKEIATYFGLSYYTICDWFKRFHIQIYSGVIKGTPSPKKGKPGPPAWNKGLTKETDERVRKVSESSLGKKMSESARKKMSIKARDHWENLEIAKKMIVGLSLKPNKSEIKLNTILKRYFPNEWKYVGDGQLIISGLCPDFINCNGKKKIIELFGERWHKGENVGINRTEGGRRKVFKEIGFDMLVIWDKELKDETSIICKIQSWMDG